MIFSERAIELFSERTQRPVAFWTQKFSAFDDTYGLITVGDADYPELTDSLGRPLTVKFSRRTGLPNKKGAPEFLFYRGDISLLDRANLQNNVAVVGLTEPDSDIVSREKKIVTELVAQGFHIVSGLAKGCDTISHETCLECDGKTIAILPSTLTKIIPAENSKLADEIVTKGGLLITEYYAEPQDRWESINRFVERDRLQAFFSSAIVLIASYRHTDAKTANQYPNDGIKRDAGSRHALRAALSLGRQRLVMYDYSISDQMNPQLDLNRDLIQLPQSPATVLTEKSIKQIRTPSPENLNQSSLF